MAKKKRLPPRRDDGTFRKRKKPKKTGRSKRR